MKADLTKLTGWKKKAAICWSSCLASARSSCKLQYKQRKIKLCLKVVWMESSQSKQEQHGDRDYLHEKEKRLFQWPDKADGLWVPRQAVLCII